MERIPSQSRLQTIFTTFFPLLKKKYTLKEHSRPFHFVLNFNSLTGNHIYGYLFNKFCRRITRNSKLLILSLHFDDNVNYRQTIKSTGKLPESMTGEGGIGHDNACGRNEVRIFLQFILRQSKRQYVF